ncbi:rod shape-determining protein RodA [Candidatus Collierbacteria bacterium CG10_big_fil_rev_8_21_14_0_10_44_9]|uniref:Rod shape-determining protein RodA n=1 Tax=Candidatus Collierbacteria bacterium CG10_big_fil_rev_8_21_14_0_10_44_9 TaxID=1974535 RepID=A0A2H0VIG3_9BACT|nr:MAG: rod shape-determining protein RodA [Candidatus Collierbacteria bacterium CG10_big_fil_rev_8_21_14_0_10_44_9]
MKSWLPDGWLTLCYLLAGALGLVVLTSISPERVGQQAIMFGIGFALFVYLNTQDAAVYKTFAPLGYVLSIFMLLATMVFGTTIRGSTRWIALGTFQLQAGEFVKPLLVLGFAFFLQKFPPKNIRNIMINLIIYLIPTLIIFKQPDLGTALIISLIWGVQMFVAGLSFWLLSGIFGFGIVFIEYLPRFLRDYQVKRLETFIDPYRDPLGAGYNVIQSIIAVGSGGIFGKGLGHGTQSHLRFLPERHTDFIFASLAEELGIIGSLLVIFCLGGILYRLLILATNSNSPTSRLIYIGIFSYLFFQTFINIGMNIGIAPVTGVTLPLISYGGSSVLATAITLGIASSCNRCDKAHTLIEIK